MKKVKLFMICLLLLFMVACVDSNKVVETPKDNETTETQIISDPPFITGHIVDIDANQQVIMISENISKEEALNNDIESFGLNVVAMNLNKTEIDQSLIKGNYVAIWKIGDGPEKSGEIIERIVLLEK